MRTPLSWLQSLTPLNTSPTDRAAVAELAGELDALGLVVEGIERVGEALHNVVLAKVLEIAPIHGADRIRRVVVDRGSGETVEVVCGAWNFSVGDVVPLAPVGAELPGGFKIERRKMKGVVSNGMICSARELGLGDDHAGILIVAPGDSPGVAVELGRPLGDHLDIGPDVVFDLSIEANRPDCLCMLGVARDLAARFGLPLAVPDPTITESDPPAGELGSVAVESPELCFRFTGRVLTNLTVVASPMLIQRRLTLAGMRPIDSVVDASNYVMLELGQPTHPYDLDELDGHGLIARAARPGEAIVTLDGETRVLGTRAARQGDPVTALDCVICNADDVPVGIGGVMGGRSSEISAGTSRVLLEAAHFLPVAVGRTARHVGLRSEASYRFERGLDPEGVERSSARVCELVVQAATAAGVPPPLIARGLLDAHPVRLERTRISVRPARVNALLGTELSAGAMAELLEPIGYSVTAGESTQTSLPALEFVVPSFRPDVRREVDVAEDVARTFGYRHITGTDRRSPYVGRLDEIQLLRRRLRRVLCGFGAHEAWTSSIVDPADQARAGWDRDLVRLMNPMVAEESALRAGLLAGLLTAVRYNSGHRHPSIRLFEVGDVFVPSAPGRSAEADGEAGSAAETGLPIERERVALILAWSGDGADTAVQAWRVLADALALTGVEVLQGWAAGEDAAKVGTAAAANHGPVISLAGLHGARSGVLVAGGGSPGQAAPIGTIGEVDPDVIASFGLPHERIGWLELDVASLAAAPRRPLLAEPVSRYPSSDVDLAFTVDEAVPAARVESVLREAAGELCESVELFDVYSRPGVDEGRRSLAYRVRFCAFDRTLTDAEIGDVRRRCIETVESTLPAALRD